MTRDDIIRMARDAFQVRFCPLPVSEGRIERFAELVAAAERDRCCRIVYGMAGSDNVAQRTVEAIRGTP